MRRIEGSQERGADFNHEIGFNQARHDSGAQQKTFACEKWSRNTRKVDSQTKKSPKCWAGIPGEAEVSL
jgi:hypothetical protein